MSDLLRGVSSLSSVAPETIAAIVQEKDRIIRAQTKRIEELEREVTAVRRDRDRLSTKLLLLAGRIPVEQNASTSAAVCATISKVNQTREPENALASSIRMNSQMQSRSMIGPRLEVAPTPSDSSHNSSKCHVTPVKFVHLNSVPSKRLSRSELVAFDSAARTIQNAYRRYLMSKNFERLRSQSERSKRLSGQAESGCTERARAGSKGEVCVGSHVKLRTIDENGMDNPRVVGDVDNTRLSVKFSDLSDSSDSESVLDTIVDPTFDESSTNFEHLLEAEEIDGGDDSFNSEDGGQEEEAFSSRCSTLRAGNFSGFPQQWYSTSSYDSTNSDSPVTTLRTRPSDNAFSDSDSTSGDTLATPVWHDDESGSAIAESQMNGELAFKLGGNYDAFVRFCAPSYSPIWKRKTGSRGSTGSLPDAGSVRSSQISSGGSFEMSESSGSFADISRNSEELSRCSAPDDSVIVADQKEVVSNVRHHVPLHRGHSETCPRGVQLDMCPPLPILSAGFFHDPGSFVQSNRMRKRIYRIGLNLFNRKPERGIKYLLENKFIDFRPNAVSKFLVSRKGLSRQMIGEYLGQIQKPFNIEVLRCFADEIDLAGLQVDVALRKYQSFFRMPGEAQKIEKLMEVFAHRYCACNLDQIKSFRSADTVFLLAFAIVMLNTDQHNRCIKDERRMTAKDFVKNLRGIDDGRDLDHDLLVGIYERVRSCEFKPASDHVTQVAKVEEMITGKKPALLVSQCRRLVCFCRLYEVPDLTTNQKLGSHQRELFLFNDLLVVTKMVCKKKKNVTYSFRQVFPLLGMAVYLFETPHYKYGVRLALAARGKELITLCARTEHDRSKFVEDLKEAILENEEMQVLESYENRKENGYRANFSFQDREHSCGHNRHSKDSGVVDVDNPSHNRLSASDCEERKNSFSSSIFDLSERQRTGSRGSLDSGMASTGSSSISSCMEPAKLGYPDGVRMLPSSASPCYPRETAVPKYKASN